MLCPGGDTVRSNLSAADWCEKGNLCTTPATRIDCPEKQYCNIGTFLDQPCPSLSVCNAGSVTPFWYLWVVIAVPIVIIFFAAYAMTFCSKGGSKEKLSSLKATTTAEVPEGARTVDIAPANQRSMNIRFENLSVAVGTGEQRKTVLNGISGDFAAGTITAIMGQSGAGKSTLMNVILGRLRETGGQIYINGRPDRLTQYSRIIGFVPQEDVMIRTLTVYDTLRHSAFTRLPSSWTKSQRNELINRTIDLLDLHSVRNTKIGEDGGKGLSAGMRKRVNIGIELCSAPGVLFLDEPTTGLDSTASQDIVSLLQRVASTGLTVIAVLHQPRFEIFKLCTNVLLLGCGGWQAFMGSTSTVLDYFQSIGYVCPTDTNPADFFLDVLALRHNKSDGQPATTEHLQSSWKNLSSKIRTSPPRTPPPENTRLVQVDAVSQAPNIVLASAMANSSRLSPVVPIVINGANREEDSMMDKILQTLGIRSSASVRKTPGFFVQTWLYLRRAVVEGYRDLSILCIQVLLQIISGMALGAGFTFQYGPPVPEYLEFMCPGIIRHLCETKSTIGQVVSYLPLFMTMIIGAVTAVAAVPTFGNNKAVYWREAASGTSALAFFLAKCTYDILPIALQSFVFLSFFMLIATVPGGFGPWYGIIITLQFAAYGFGYFVSNVVPRDRALVIAGVVGVALSVTAGQSPTITQVNEQYGPVQIVFNSSFNRWSGEGMAILVTSDAKNAGYRVDMALENLGFNPDNLPLDYGIPVLLGFTWRILAYLALRFTDREKQR